MSVYSLNSRLVSVEEQLTKLPANPILQQKINSIRTAIGVAEDDLAHIGQFRFDIRLYEATRRNKTLCWMAVATAAFTGLSCVTLACLIGGSIVDNLYRQEVNERLHELKGLEANLQKDLALIREKLVPLEQRVVQLVNNNNNDL